MGTHSSRITHIYYCWTTHPFCLGCHGLKGCWFFLCCSKLSSHRSKGSAFIAFDLRNWSRRIGMGKLFIAGERVLKVESCRLWFSAFFLSLCFCLRPPPSCFFLFDPSACSTRIAGTFRAQSRIDGVCDQPVDGRSCLPAGRRTTNARANEPNWAFTNFTFGYLDSRPFVISTVFLSFLCCVFLETREKKFPLISSAILATTATAELSPWPGREVVTGSSKLLFNHETTLALRDDDQQRQWCRCSDRIRKNEQKSLVEKWKFSEEEECALINVSFLLLLFFWPFLPHFFLFSIQLCSVVSSLIQHVNAEETAKV